MFEGISLSGFAICYGPLALTIIGFAVFAGITDADARRRYLRRPGEEKGEIKRTEPLTAETPSGGLVTINPSEDSSSSRGSSSTSSSAVASSSDSDSSSDSSDES